MSNTVITNRDNFGFTVQLTVPYRRSMLEGEDAVQAALNDAGNVKTGEILERFDTDGSPIMIGDTKWTSKGKISKHIKLHMEKPL